MLMSEVEMNSEICGTFDLEVLHTEKYKPS